MLKTVRVPFVLLSLGIVTLPTAAEDDAASWFARMTDRAERGHYKVSTSAEMTINQQGMLSRMRMSGKTNFVTKDRFRISIDMTMNMGGMDVSVRMLTVADGENFWLETDSQMAGGKQVMTGRTADLERYAELGQASLSGVGGIGGDPASEIRNIAKKFDMKVTSQENGRVTLHADVTPETAVAADLGPFAASMTYITLVIDEKQVVPLRLQLGGEQPIITMNFTDYEFFEPGDIQASDYAYTPPQGVQVNDLSSMLQ